MNITLDFRTKRPICEQIQNELRLQILQGQLLPGDQLPAVRDLAAVLKINFNTVARAYRVLDHQGWISTQQGRGTFVLEPPTEPKIIEKEAVDQKFHILINRFMAEVERLKIPDDQIRNALAEIINRTGKNGGPTIRRSHKRISRKYFFNRSSLDWSTPNCRIKKRHKKP